MPSDSEKNFRFNFIVSVLDGSAYGFGLGFASYVTILPLFISQMTDSAILIGLIVAIRSMGWQLPQLLIVNRVARLSRYKPMALWMIVQERWFYVGLAVIAWFLPGMNHTVALLLTFGLLIWNGLGAGLTATPWQALIAKIIPAERRGTFFGVQGAAANLFISLSAIIAGLILERTPAPLNFTLCFICAAVFMALSMFFFATVREPTSAPSGAAANPRAFWGQLRGILQRDANFRWFIIARMLSQLAVMSISFYTVYAVRTFGMSAGVAGLMTGVFTAAQIAASMVMGWLGDRWSHRGVMEVGILAAVVSALLAWLAPSLNWFYLVFVLAGIANVAVWTIAIAMTLEFGTQADRPAYIGLANTLIAPSTILFPLLGGWLADSTGYPTTFIAAALGGLATAGVIQVMLKDPRRDA